MLRKNKKIIKEILKFHKKQKKLKRQNNKKRIKINIINKRTRKQRLKE